jgi:hypothetical protein
MIKARADKNCYSFNNLQEILDSAIKCNLDFIDMSGLEMTTIPSEILTLPKLEKFICCDCEIDDLDLNNSNIIYLNITDNKLKSIPLNMNKMVALNISGNNITNIDNLPDTIELLGVDNCEIEVINKLPFKLKKLYCSYSGVKKINCEFPPELIDLSLVGNELQDIPKVHSNIKILDLSANPLTNFIPPTTLEKFNIDKECLGKVKHNEVFHHNRTFRL